MHVRLKMMKSTVRKIETSFTSLPPPGTMQSGRAFKSRKLINWIEIVIHNNLCQNRKGKKSDNEAEIENEAREGGRREKNFFHFESMHRGSVLSKPSWIRKLKIEIQFFGQCAISIASAFDGFVAPKAHGTSNTKADLRGICRSLVDF